MCKEYLVLERERLTEFFLHHARRFTEDEKKKYAEWFRDQGFVAVGEWIRLEYIKLKDCKDIIQDRDPDGAFCGTDNACYIIDEAQWEMLLAVNEKNKKAAIIREIEEQIARYKKIVEKCEAQGKLYTKEEAIQKQKEYNLLYNEGGYGYIPHYHTIEEYDYAKKQLTELEKELKKEKEK